MVVSVIVLNGASSAGKSSIARALQDVLWPEPWLAFGIDTLLGAVPSALGDADEGIRFRPDGSIVSGPLMRSLWLAWNRGLRAMVDANTNLVIDEVFLDGADSQARLRQALGDLDVLWVGVRCSVEEATRRERARGDRVVGQAAHQAEAVHDGVVYDIEVDTTDSDPRRCAEIIAATVRR